MSSHSPAAVRQTRACEGATFETVLPRLVSAYEQGRLVPFIGAGMSVRACHLWQPFVARLEEKAGGAPPVVEDGKPDSLILRANRAIGRMRALGTAALADNVRAALFTGEQAIPPQTIALSRLYWPLVLTTNYDDCLLTAFQNAQRATMTICGRGVDDTQFVLNALYEPAEPILWALQGYLGGPAGPPSNALAHEIVVGHEEYRKVAHAEPHFRRAFAEVFRSRSMLFLGSGLQEPYFREMFNEILEIYGPCVRPHYAFVKRGDLDAQFMATRFQIIVVEYDDHNAVAEWLNELSTAAAGRAFRQDRFSFALRESRIDDAETPCSRLTVVRGRLPKPVNPDECVTVSAGGGGAGFFFSPPIQRYLGGLGIRDYPPKLCDDPPRYIARFHDAPVYAARAREAGDFRALRTVRLASAALFDAAVRDGFRRIYMQLLASGGAADTPRSYNVRPFSPLFSFIESVRAFGEWCRRNPERPLELTLCVLDPSVYLEISRGRLNIDELLSSVDLRFWAKIVYPDGKIQRQICQELDVVTVGGLVAWLGLDPEQWSVQSFPRTGSATEPAVVKVRDIREEPISARVIPGGTLRFTVKS